ncbi:hypothetical protein ES319_D11G062900v1 [Gossypium barbadense]|uniref:GRF-type domain-containing protein n=2 Tax=Gossypium TaxID=3633 RepID=A0A5J5P7S9_GOSBA|nr:hypothetical protein ES319_D11G062900v1 [Gossypium barbadense]TYG44031.1 hypothetical protein ES288_D11G065600v1 [Gossypium darwinii]
MELPYAILECYCGLSASFRTSWSNENPRRRVFDCENYGHRFKSSCRFFKWFDLLLCPRSRALLVGLLR